MGTQPFISIVTRTFGGRPQLYAKHLSSVEAQTFRDFDVVTIRNGHTGVFDANCSLAHHAELVTGQWVHILDDDDRYADANVLNDFAIVQAHYPRAKLIICRMRRPDRIVPDNDHWRQKPVGGHIGTPCLFVRNDLWQAHIRKFCQPCRGDYNFLMSMWPSLTRHDVVWWDRIATDIMVVSQGTAETRS